MAKALSVKWTRITDAEAKADAIDVIQQHVAPISASAIRTLRGRQETDSEGDAENINPSRAEDFGDLEQEEIYAFNARIVVVKAIEAAEEALKKMIGVRLDAGREYDHIEGIEDAACAALSVRFNNVPYASMEVDMEDRQDNSLLVTGEWVTTGKALRDAGFTIAKGKATPPPVQPEAP